MTTNMPDDIADIQRRYDAWVESDDINMPRTAPGDILALLTYADRLRAENAAMREVVALVAEWPMGSGPCNDECHYCGAVIFGEIELHTPDCPVTKARALLAQQPETERTHR